MKIEEVIGRRMAEVRELNEFTQEQIGQRIGEVTGKPWSRQAVHSAEKGNRQFSAADLLVIAQALGTTVPRLMTPPLATREVELQAGVAVDRAELAGLTLPRASGAKSYDGAAEILRTLAEAVYGQQQYYDTVWKSLDALHQALTTAAEARVTEVKSELEERGK